MTGFRRGVRLGIDVGRARVGVARSDPDGMLELSDAQVSALCDRRFGIGADGTLRVVRSAALPEGAATPDAEWFMDYRNADGSAAEMCGNGIRVFAKYLVETGLADIDAAPIAIGTRASRHGPIERGCSTFAPVVAISCASA